MRHLNLELEKLEQRIAPGILGSCNGSGSKSKTKQSKSKSHESKSHESKSKSHNSKSKSH